MTTFIKAKIKKSDDQTYIYKYRVAAKIKSFKWSFGHNYRVAKLSTSYLTVLIIIILR